MAYPTVVGSADTTGRTVVPIARAIFRTSGRNRDIWAPVSVVVPCFRCAHTIEQAVSSVARQKLRPAEVLLVDDGSGDDTLARLKGVARRYPPGWVKVLGLPENRGPSAARNWGWENATQPWVAFLDADDSWHPHKLRLQMQAVDDDPRIALIAHDMNVQARGKHAPALRYPIRCRPCPNRLSLWHKAFPTASVVLRRDLPFRFDENRRRAEDFMLWAQILLSGYRCARLNQVLASWHKPPFGAGGLSGDLTAMYRAAVDVRNTLHKQRLLTTKQLYIAHAAGFARYLRRCLITLIRRRVVTLRDSTR
ncbi:glycosyltransferase family 2 protein [Dyella choica]|uniref:Glycosyltransferase family 2 protein n=1 Tax=Dyella choica TaxID=1927959 RepID=A0A3S0R4Z3_9GAMM|nr:glycosyltransferase family 2 protein [Dyella choica]RUL77670.1 glycosyltransferase family 2 protein [Dyella choica]